MLTPRTGTYSCACGKVSIDIVQPFTSFGLVQQTSAVCQCKDCIGFSRAVNDYRTKHISERLSKETDEKANVLRKFGHHAVHMMQFYKNFIHTDLSKHSLKKLPPTVVLNHSSGPTKSDLLAPPNVIVRNGIWAPIFLFRVIVRVLLGFILGKGFSPIGSILDDIPPGKGLKSIGLTKKKEN